MNRQQIQSLIVQTEANYGLPSGLLDRLVALESSYNLNAYNSASGASGLTQIITRFHPTVSNPFDPYESLDYAARRLRGWFDEFGDWRSAVAAWHSGEGAVRKARARGQAVPGTVDRITGLPTTTYADRIVGDLLPANQQSGFDLSNFQLFGLSPTVSVLGILAFAAFLVVVATDDT